MPNFTEYMDDILHDQASGRPTPMDQAARNDYAGRLTALQALQKSEGWQLFIAQCEIALKMEAQIMANTTSAHDAAKHIGAWKVIQDLMEWPQREVSGILAFLKED